MRFLDKKNINDAIVEKEVFPFFHTENAFIKSLDPEHIIDDFPNITSGGSYPVNDLVAGPLKELVAELEGREFKNILENKLNVDLKDAQVITTLRGFSRLKDGQIHTDSKTKILTVLLYLNPNWDSNIGNLRLLNENNNLNNYIKEISSSFGNLVAFKVTENCWHGFEPFEGKRLSIQLNYVYPDAFKTHSLRHTVSSFFKRLTPRTKI